MHFIGLDVGTTRCKAVLFDAEGNCICGASREYGYSSVLPGWAEQNPEEVWQVVQGVLCEIAQKTKVKPEALAVSAQGEAVIFLDQRGSVLRPAILGMDMRAQKESEELAERFGAEHLLNMAGVPVHPLTSAAKILWIRKNEPEIFAKSTRIFCYEDFILWKLGGCAAIDYSMASKTLLFDRYAKRWSQEILEYLGLSPKQLATPFPAGQVVGTISKNIAQSLGLPESLRLVTGGHDQCCAALGAGSTTQDIAFDNAGTAEVLGIPVDDGSLVLRIHPQTFSCYNHVLPGKFLLATLNQTAGLFLRWYRDTFGRYLVAQYPDRDPYEVLIERAATEPSRVLALPHLVGSGTPWVDSRSKAAFVGITLATTEGEIIRAILEGVVFEQKLNVEFLETQGVSFREIRVTGGCSRSPLWLQIRADIFGKPVVTLECEDASALGAAILAACGNGTYASPEEGAKAMVRMRSVWEPDSKRHEIYRERFSVYRDLYGALRAINHRIG